MRPWLVFLNGQDHLRLRRLLNKTFTPRVVENLRPGIQSLADGLIDAVQEQGSIEAMSQFTHPLPALVIAQLLGVPATDRPKFVEWSDEMMVFFTGLRASLEIAYRAQAALVAMRDYFRGIVADRRQRPGDDLISLMIRVEEQGDMLTEDQLLAQCTLFFSDPDRFDITRTDTRPASFAFGPHVCIGMPLAYLEAELAIATILQRLPNLRLLIDRPEWIAKVAFRGLRSLPLAFDPVQPQHYPS